MLDKYGIDSDELLNPNPIDITSLISDNNGVITFKQPKQVDSEIEAVMLKAIEMARETESVRRGALSEDWDDVEKYTEEEIINKLR